MTDAVACRMKLNRADPPENIAPNLDSVHEDFRYSSHKTQNKKETCIHRNPTPRRRFCGETRITVTTTTQPCQHTNAIFPAGSASRRFNSAAGRRQRLTPTRPRMLSEYSSNGYPALCNQRTPPTDHQQKFSYVVR